MHSRRLHALGLLLPAVLAGSLSARPTGAQQPRDLPLAELETLARRDSNDATVQYRLAMAYWEKKKWDQAEQALRQALVVAPSYPEAHLALGVLPDRRGEGYWKRRAKDEGESAVVGDLIRAGSHYRKAVQLNPLVDLRVFGKFEERGRFSFIPFKGGFLFFPTPWWDKELVKGMNEFREGRYQQAHQRFVELTMDRRFSGRDVDLPGDLLWYQGLAAAHLGNFDQAVRNLAILTGRAGAAERDTSSVISAIPLQANHYRFLMATMLYLGGRYDEAIPTFRRALEFDLSLYEAHMHLARMHAARGEPERELAEWRRALDVNPGDADLLTSYAYALIRGGQLTHALDALREAAASNPRDPRVPYLRGIVAEQLGQGGEARAAYQRFLEIAPSRFAEETTDARQRLAGLP